MGDIVNLEWVRTHIRAIQTELRTMRTENALTRSGLSEAIRLLSERIGNFESKAWLGRLEAALGGRVDKVEAQMNARFDHLEAIISGRP